MRLSLFVPPLAPVILNAVKDTLPPFVLPVYPEERRAPTSSSAFHRLTRRNITATERSHSTSKLSEGEPKRLAPQSSGRKKRTGDKPQPRRKAWASSTERSH
jgi:hypothetical protein